MISRVFVYNKICAGFPRRGDIKVLEEYFAPLQDGEILAEARFISIEPLSPLLNEGQATDRVVQGFQVAKVIKSKHKNFSVGKYVIGDFGCRTLTICTPKETSLFPWIIPDIGKHSLSLALGVLGVPGNIAYFGFNEVCKPKQNDTVVISGAAGAVGSTVGQLAKNAGCNVIGITGSDEKGRWLIDTLGFDHYINYKTQNLSTLLDKYAPEGVDIYFDSVGGNISSSVIYKIKKSARIAVCGVLAAAGGDNVKAPEIQSPIKIKTARMEGILATRWKNRWFEGVGKNFELLNEGKLKPAENVVDGFDNIPQALEQIALGQCRGKTVIKI